MTRPPILRIRKILERIQEGKYPSRKLLAKLTEFTPRTIQRDITYMREQLEMPIEYDFTKRGYYLTKPIKDFPMFQVSEGELVALFIAHKALAQHHGTPFEKPLQTAIEKLVQGLQGRLSVAWADLDSAISFRGIDANPADLTTFQTISYAVQFSHEISFDYKKLNSASFERRQVRPYHLACINNQWYLFGFDLLRNEIRSFVLPRMRNPTRTNISFERPKDFSINDYLKGSFGVFSAEGKFSVKVRFDKFAAQLVREKMWHYSQATRELAGGELELSLQLTSLKEIEPWILSWGSHALVLEPRELCENIALTAKHVTNAYHAHME